MQNIFFFLYYFFMFVCVFLQQAGNDIFSQED